MNKNINQNYLLQIDKILEKIEKSKDAANHFRCIVLMGDTQEEKATSFFHASFDDMKNLILNAMRSSDEFAYTTAAAIEQYSKELQEKQQESESINNKDNEENPIQEA